MDANGSWLQCYGVDDEAVAVEPLNIKADQIHIHTIAHALSLQCRFAGHTRKFFSVAQHSVNVAVFIEIAGGSHIEQLMGLLHDAAEAYCVDVPSPLKRDPALYGYRDIEERIQAVVAVAFQLPFPLMTEPVVAADMLALSWEARDILQPTIPAIWNPLPDLPPHLPKLQYWTSEFAERTFLLKFRSLVRYCKVGDPDFSVISPKIPG